MTNAAVAMVQRFKALADAGEIDDATAATAIAAVAAVDEATEPVEAVEAPKPERKAKLTIAGKPASEYVDALTAKRAKPATGPQSMLIYRLTGGAIFEIVDGERVKVGEAGTRLDLDPGLDAFTYGTLSDAIGHLLEMQDTVVTTHEGVAYTLKPVKAKVEAHLRKVARKNRKARRVRR